MSSKQKKGRHDNSQKQLRKLVIGASATIALAFAATVGFSGTASAGYCGDGTFASRFYACPARS